MSSEFTVAAIVKEPAQKVHQFISWYLGQGASRIRIFLDDPDDPIFAELSAIPRVEPIRCTADFWAQVGISPDRRFPRRQNHAITSFYQTLTEGWLLNVDADELMYFEGTTLSDAIKLLPRDALSVRVATAEQVHLTNGGEAFRIPISRRTVNRVYGDMADFFRPHLGLLGHADGKAFHRAGQRGIRLRQHWAEDQNGNPVEALHLNHSNSAYLLHFVAPSYDDWREKLEWRLSSISFAAALREKLMNLHERDPDPESAYAELWSRLYSLTPTQQSQLEAEGGLLSLPSRLSLSATTTKASNKESPTMRVEANNKQLSLGD